MSNLAKANPANLQIGATKCCNAKWFSIPACFGDPAMTICSKCTEHAEIVWRPMYKEVSRGTFRLIDYSDSGKEKANE